MSRIEAIVEAQAGPAKVGDFKPCTATLILATDSLTCDLNRPTGHAGPHRGTGKDGRRFFWQYERPGR